MKYAEIYNSTIVTKSLIDTGQVCFELLSCKSEKIARNCGALLTFVPRTELKDNVANKKKKIEV